MANRREIVKLLLEGKTAPQIMEALRLPPSKLRRALASRRMAEVLLLSRRTAEVGMALSSGAMVETAVGQLVAVAGGDNAEAARRACMTILAAATGGGAAAGAPPAPGLPPPAGEGSIG